MTSPPTNLLCQYRYDPLDRLVHQTQPDTPAHQRFYCKRRLATEIHGAMQQSIIQYGDLLLAQQQRLGDLVDTTLLLTDLQRSVLHSLKKDHQPQAIAYSPYGHRSLLSGLLSLLGFNGERPDPVTGCYLLGNGYRAFNPVLMRFNSPDSWSPFGKGGLNSYVYCLGDPVNQADPTGHVGVPRLVSFFNHMNDVPAPASNLPSQARPLSPPPAYAGVTPRAQRAPRAQSVTPSPAGTAQPIATPQPARPPAYSVNDLTSPPQSKSDVFTAQNPPPNYFDVVPLPLSEIRRSAPHRTLQTENASGATNQRRNMQPATDMRQIRHQATSIRTNADDLEAMADRLIRQLNDALAEGPHFDA